MDKKKAVKKKVAKKKVVNEVGRPTDYDAKYCKLLIAHMSEGLSYEAFAGVIGVCKQSLYNWEKVNKEFMDAKKIGTEKCKVFWEQLAIDHIINKSDSESQGDGVGWSKSRSINATIWIFNMKNRFGWRDKQPDEDSVNITVNLADKVAKARARADKAKK